MRPNPSWRLGALALLAAAPLSAQQPAGSQGASVSPDGRHILFSSDRDGASALYVMNEDGSGVTRIATPPGAPTRGRWASDGKRVLTTIVQSDTVRVVSVAITDGTTMQLGQVIAPGARAAAVHDDGARLAIGVGDWAKMQLYTAKLGDAAAKRITDGDGAYWCEAFSRDGGRLAVAHMGAAGQMQTIVMNADGSGAQTVTSFTKAEGNPQCPAWSPDGTRLAVQSSTPDLAEAKKHIGNIWIIDLESRRATKLAEHTVPYEDELPSWFPDGKRIAFQSNRTGRWEIWVMNVDGSGARQVTR